MSDIERFGRPIKETTSDTVEKIDDILFSNQRLKVLEIVTPTGIS